MFLLVGEKTRGTVTPTGQKYCGVCDSDQEFGHVVETNYFCVFGLPLMRLERVADYHECESCHHAFGDDLDEPSHLTVVRRILVYILLGYGMHDHRDVAASICQKLTAIPFDDESLTTTMRALDNGSEDIFAFLRDQARRMNLLGKQQAVQAAFLMTHACCEIQYEDRLRINLVGNALGVSTSFVAACIETVRSHNYYGVRRVLPTQAL